MQKFKSFAPVFVLGLFLTGCASTTITGLTPRMLPRSPDNLYPIEVQLDSTQQSLVWSTIQANVIIVGTSTTYPMTLTPKMTNRWEALVPVSSPTDKIQYRVKFDFQYLAWGVPPQDDSVLSRIYPLQITGN